MESDPANPSLPDMAFTLVELLIVIAMIAILAGLLLPALAKAKAKAQSTGCISNLHQMAVAWNQYVLENDDVMPPSMTPGAVGVEGNPGSWVLGNAQRDTDTTNIQQGVLYRYVGSPSVYRCPADKSVVSGHPGLRRTRSYSMNWWLNSNRNGIETPNTTPEDKTKLSQLISPTQIFVLADENEKTINDGSLVVPSDKYAPPDQWWDMPSDRHSQSCNFFFADGHYDQHKWKWPKIRQSDGQPPSMFPQMIANSQDRDDLYWTKAASIPE